ncbi:hypothetical protein [Streptomyces roseochromogenus]|uniref:Histidine decarboxylase n=1 Tax=Streptomyces roseochromogenus subsp. oscitans DS 12.976 TaxID=1352936 RepID=V6KC46_STRRC|nr:hypothetical protein [Streptomyces roseochromogenus]EST29618.1 hypothetical protein M878_20015 [Streptomyces roseochromogenus subsp. oscitans DS 12.976]
MTEVTSSPQQLPQFPFGPNGETWEELVKSQGLADGHRGPVSHPTKDPRTTYPAEPGLEAGEFELSPCGLTDAQRRKAICSMELYLADKRNHMLGYQVTQDMNGYPADLSRFMEDHVNNVGDPFRSGGYKPNTKVAERAVLDYYAALWNAQWPHDPQDPESYWGYMLSMGSTEGNMYALWNARDYLSGKALLNPDEATLAGAAAGAVGGAAGLEWVQAIAPDKPTMFRPVAFYSEDTHYSFAKAVRVLNVDTFYAVAQDLYKDQCPLTDKDGKRLPWPKDVPSLAGPSQRSWDGTGQIDIEALATLVDFFAERGHPILVSLNLGSTFKGAHDDVRAVCEKLLPIFEERHLLRRELVFGKNAVTGEPIKDIRRGFWIHVDGALGAAYVPFMRMAYQQPGVFDWTPEVELPEFDFGLTAISPKGVQMDMVASIAMSGHKWPGAPWPCGIYMTKVKYQLEPPAKPQYIGAPDTTFAGSRNGFSPLVLWDHLARHSYEDQINKIKEAQRLAELLLRQLQDLKKTHGLDLWPARSPGALTVRFRKPSEALVAKWSLSCEDVLMNPEEPKKKESWRSYAHVFVMSSVTEKKIKALIKDLAEEGISPLPEVDTSAALAAMPATQLADNVRPLARVPITNVAFQ